MDVTAEDHDTLIRIETKLDVFRETQLANHAENTKEIADIKARTTAIERIQDRQAGFLAGGKALWVIIGAIPGIAGVVYGFTK